MTNSPLLAHEEFPILGQAYFLGGRASTSVKRVLAECGVDAETTGQGLAPSPDV